ncbi:Rad1/Rec1/Rad17 [Mortierella sp. GBAus27b]|nr:Rad1/Rec1/Rad17 [Mortierella sp. GBAus27b]
MSLPRNQCRFTARLRNVRHLAAVAKSIHFKDLATCRISAEGVSFNLEESRCLFARCLIQKQVFEDYSYLSPAAEEHPLDTQSQFNSQHGSQYSTRFNQRMPPGYEPDGSVSFGINLGTLLSCLNMFGTAGVTGSMASDSGFMGGGNALGPATAVKLSYNGIGSTLDITLEDNGSVTTCGIPTSDPEPPVDIEFVEENYSKIIMKAQWLEEGLRDLDSTSDRAVFRLSPEIPHLRISSLGTMENLDVNYSQGDVLETFVYHYDQPIEISYNFSHVLHMLRVCPMATKANIAIDTRDTMRIQFLIPISEQKFLFSEYAFCPLELMD